MSQPTSSPTPNLQPSPAPAIANGGANPPVTRERRVLTTGGVVAWWRLVVVLSCLLVAVVAPMVLNNNKSGLERVNAAGQQVLLLQSVRGEVLAAEVSATQALLISAPGATPDDAYVDHLAMAAQRLTLAATMTPPDRDGLVAANRSLIVHTAHLSAAMAAGSTDQMGMVSTNLQANLLPLLDQQINQNLVLLDVSSADQRWLSALVAVPIVLMVAASVVVARRTRRVFNIGLLVGLGISILLWVNVTELVTTSAKSVGAVQTSGVAQATSVAQAYAAITEAKAVEGRVLLGIVPADEGGRAYAEATTKAAEMLALLPNAESDGMPGQLEQMVSAHDKLIAAPSGQRPALMQAARQPYDALVVWLAQQSDQIGVALDQQLSDHANTIRNALGFVAAGMLLAALAAGVGLSQPLRRYR